MELKEIKEALDSDFTTSFEAASEKVPVDRAMVLLPCDTRDDLILELMYVPGLKSHLDECKLLQLFVIFHSKITDDKKDALKTHLLNININAPLVGFGLHEEDNFIYFKYMLAMPLKDNSGMKGVIRETVWLISYMIDLFLPSIEAITGKPESKLKK